MRCEGLHSACVGMHSNSVGLFGLGNLDVEQEGEWLYLCEQHFGSSRGE